MRDWLAVLVCLLCLNFAEPAMAGSNETAFLQSIAGNWRVSGWIRQSANGQEEALRCRIKSHMKSDNELKQDGVCSVSGIKFGMDGYIRYRPQTGKFTANVFENLSNLPVVGVTGELTNEGLVMIVRRFAEQFGKMVNALILISIQTKNEFKIEIRDTDYDFVTVYDAGLLTFKRVKPR